MAGTLLGRLWCREAWPGIQGCQGGVEGCFPFIPLSNTKVICFTEVRFSLIQGFKGRRGHLLFTVIGLTPLQSIHGWGVLSFLSTKQNPTLTGDEEGWMISVSRDSFINFSSLLALRTKEIVNAAGGKRLSWEKIAAPLRVTEQTLGPLLHFWVQSRWNRWGFTILYYFKASNKLANREFQTQKTVELTILECRTKLNQGDVHCHTEIARQEPIKVSPSYAGGLFGQDALCTSFVVLLWHQSESEGSAKPTLIRRYLCW